jgi:putative acetyltransferase
MMGDPEVFPSLLQLPLPSEEMWRDRLTEPTGAARHDLQLVAELDGVAVGNAGLHLQPHLRRRHVATLGIGVAGSARRRGVGAALMQALCDHADHWAQILRIELTVFTDNEPALALYGRFGFRQEGTHRAYAMRHGTYADVHCMARLHPQRPVIAWPEA